MQNDLKNFNLPELEKKILEFWKKNNVFEKSVENRLKAKAKTFRFFEGPPTANGRPGIHHVLARSFKDVILRYKTMRGFAVPRRAGWDTHGLPVEIAVEKELGLKSKKDIEKFGIAEFNKKCRESVWKYKDEWEKLTERIGFWLDMKNPYITYETSYIESLWWIFSEAWKKKLLYQGHKVLSWCPRCGTALSSHELAQGYKTITDEAVIVKFLISNSQFPKSRGLKEKTYILSWTTTPWTLPGNVALAMGKNIEYAEIELKETGEHYILASRRIENIFPAGSYAVVKKVSGHKLVGLHYEPLFNVKPLQNKKSYQVYAADFVTTNEGTGVVHTAVMYGEDDYNLGVKEGLPQHHTVDEQGKFTKDVPGLEGLRVKAKETEEKIINQLKTRNYLLKTESYVHEYPHCWRCETPVIYYARNSWFLKMSSLKKKLLASNKDINWIPSHFKEGRFGEWLREVKDWAISRDRYWGTPLPIWECEKCRAREMVESREKLAARLGSAQNRYILMRHGEGEHLLANIINGNPNDLNKYPLTIKGRAQVEKAANALRKEKIDLIVASDFLRTFETARIIAGTGKTEIPIVKEERLREVNTGIFDGGEPEKYHDFFSSTLEQFTKCPPEGETLSDIVMRTHAALLDLEKKYKDKTILIVTHEYPAWALETSMHGWSIEESAAEKERRGEFLEVGEFENMDFLKLPRSEDGFVDLHRPYIDEVVFKCEKCSGEMHRIKEVADVWFDSGAVPFASVHYPFESGHKSSVISRKFVYPADYISEAVDQTRGWFYTLLAVATILGREAPYKNVISLGHLLDKRGQKMSKSKGNVVDPWVMIEKYGADAVRWHFFTVNEPGEPKKFDEADLQKTLRRTFLILWNSLAFLKMYESEKGAPIKILDEWLRARLNELISEATTRLDRYDVTGAAKLIEQFVDDLSRWYIRRSRKNMSPRILMETLETMAKLMAPFTPFFAEALYIEVSQRKSSVHLEDFPEADKKTIDKKLLVAMTEVRRIASEALAFREKEGIKVRQPLAALKIRGTNFQFPISNFQTKKELIQLLQDEINVKAIIFDSKLETKLELNTKITPELYEEGLVREFSRMIQQLRQDAKCHFKDTVTLRVAASKDILGVLEKHEKKLKTFLKARTISFVERGTVNGEKFDAVFETKFHDQPTQIWLRKI